MPAQVEREKITFHVFKCLNCNGHTWSEALENFIVIDLRASL